MFSYVQIPSHLTAKKSDNWRGRKCCSAGKKCEKAWHKQTENRSDDISYLCKTEITKNMALKMHWDSLFFRNFFTVFSEATKIRLGIVHIHSLPSSHVYVSTYEPPPPKNISSKHLSKEPYLFWPNKGYAASFFPAPSSVFISLSSLHTQWWKKLQRNTTISVHPCKRNYLDQGCQIAFTLSSNMVRFRRINRNLY